MNINDENIGKLFQQKLNGMEVQPDQAVWASIEKQAGISSGMSVLAKVALYIAATVLVATSYIVWQEFAQPIQNTPVENIAQIEKDIPVATQSEEKSEQLIIIEEEMLTAEDNQQTTTIPNKPQQSKITILPTNDTTNLEEQKQVVETRAVPTPIQIKEEKPIEQIYQPQLISFEDDVNDIETSLIDSDSIVTSSHNSDTANIKFSENPVICFGEDATLEVIGGVNYEWSSGSNASKVKVSPVEESIYWVVVYDRYGNDKKHDFTVFVDKECTSIFIPSAFTPNGDGVNDVFKAEGLGIQSFEMIIYSREGSVMFESSSIDNSWDGTFRGEPVPPVGYLYQVVYTDAKGNIHSKKGLITLIR